jgi:hypothetical protein
MGNLGNQSWSEILSGPKARQALKEVDQCQQNCWMVGTAKTAMRNPRFQKLPRLKPVAWVVHNKIRLMLGRNIDFRQYVDYPTVIGKTPAPDRPSHLNETVKEAYRQRTISIIPNWGFVNGSHCSLPLGGLSNCLSRLCVPSKKGLNGWLKRSQAAWPVNMRSRFIVIQVYT